jgi:hypothetical protein
MLHSNSSAGTAAQKSSKSSLIQRPAIILAMLLLCAVFSGCSHEEESKRRYFFIGYDVSNSETRNVGNFYSTGELRNVDSFTNVVYRMFKCENFSREQCIITSIFEFKDSSEYNMFKNGRGSYVFACDSAVSSK